MASQEELDRLKEIRDIERELAGIRSDTLNDVRDMSNFLSDSASKLTTERAERNQIRSIARQINKAAQESYTISQKELGTSKNLAKIQKDKSDLSKKIASLNQIQNKLLADGGEIQRDVAENIGFQVQETQKLLAELEEVEATSSNIANNLGVKTFNALEDLSQAIPGLRVLSGPFKDAAESARDMASSGGSAAEAFAAGATSLASAAKAAIPLLLLAELVGSLKSLDESSGKLAKNLGISYDEALGLQQELYLSSLQSNNLFINTQNLVESQIQLSDALGTNAKLNQELLVTQTKLTKQAGYSVEAATQLGVLSLATGKSTEDITTQFLGQAKALNLTNNLALNEKQLLESVAKTSKGTLATFAAKPKELAKAVFAAKKLGLEISQVEKIADGLLDIESSLTAEFEAEVISGKQLNLERARFFALTNDIAGVSEELGKQGITQASFAKSSRIEQEAVAAAMGMSRDELGQMLIEQNALAAVGAKDSEAARAKFEALKAQHGEAYAIAHLGDETYAQQLASVSNQEKFVELTNKLRDAFVSIAGPVLQIITPIVDILAPILSGIAQTVGFIVEGFKSLAPVLVPILGIMNAMWLKSKAIAIFEVIKGAWSSLGSIPFAGPALAAAAIAGGVGYIKSQKVQDGIAPSDKGPFTITDSYGATAITAKGDGLAVSPNIRREENNTTINNTNNRNTPTNVTVTLSKNDIKSIADAVRDGASKANINVNLDGNKIANNIQTPLAVNTRRYSV